MSLNESQSSVNPDVFIHQGMGVDQYLQAFRLLEKRKAEEALRRETPPRKFTEGRKRVVLDRGSRICITS